MSLDKVTPGSKVPEAFNVIIEIPMNSDPVKYEVDKESGALFVDRFMGTAMHYPTNYGYVPQTIAGDGDPVDVLVMTPFPLPPGVVVPCRALGILMMEDEGGLKLQLFKSSLKAARKYRLNEGRVGLGTKLMYWIGSKLVFSKIKERFGGRLMGSITGSAQMNEEVANFFSDIGIYVYNCYGLSETSPAITMNSPELNRSGSVGTALEFIKIRIDKTLVDDQSEDGEIQVKGPNLMLGYHNKPEIT